MNQSKNQNRLMKSIIINNDFSSQASNIRSVFSQNKHVNERVTKNKKQNKKKTPKTHTHFFPSLTIVVALTKTVYKKHSHHHHTSALYISNHIPHLRATHLGIRRREYFGDHNAIGKIVARILELRPQLQRLGPLQHLPRHGGHAVCAGVRRGKAYSPLGNQNGKI